MRTKSVPPSPFYNDAMLAMMAVLPGLVLAVFDRSCTYTAVYGGLTEDLAVGRKVGALNPECGAQLLEAARACIRNAKPARLTVTFKGRVLDVRLHPWRQPMFGVVGGVLSAWDVEARDGSG